MPSAATRADAPTDAIAAVSTTAIGFCTYAMAASTAAAFLGSFVTRGLRDVHQRESALLIPLASLPPLTQ